VSARGTRPASLARNTIALTVGTNVGYVFSFVSAPIILAGLGLRNFGIWAVAGALGQYGALLDLGVGGSLSRYIAVHQDDRRLCGQYMAIGWLSVLVIAVVLAPFAFIGAAPLSRALHGISAAHMRVVLYCGLVLLCSSMLSGVIGAFPNGRRRMMWPNLGIVIGSAINFVASVGSIALGAKLPGYALANAGAGILSVFVLAGIVVATEGPLPLALPGWRRARSFLAFSINTQLVRIASLVNYQTDKLVIAFSVGPAPAGAYELANRVAIAVRQLGLYGPSAVDVELTALVARFGLDAVRPRYERLNEIAATLSFPPVLLAMATAPLLLGAWLGHAPPNSIAILVALSAAYLLAVSTGIGYSIAVAAGQPSVVAKAAVGAAVLNIVLTASLAPVFGIWGVLGGTVVALSVGAIGQMLMVHRRLSWPVSSYFRAIGPPLRVYVLLTLPVAAISYAGLVHGRAASAGLFVSLSLSYLAACGAWALRAGRLPALITRRLPRVSWLQPPRRAEPAVPDTAVEPRARVRDRVTETVRNG
jgi:O-antigen/teichoic acid export membrane protein